MSITDAGIIMCPSLATTKASGTRKGSLVRPCYLHQPLNATNHVATVGRHGNRRTVKHVLTGKTYYSALCIEVAIYIHAARYI